MKASADWDGDNSPQTVTDEDEATLMCEEIEASAKDPGLVGFVVAGRAFFALGLGASDSCAIFWQLPGPPYFQSRGHEPSGSAPITYSYHQPTEIAASAASLALRPSLPCGSSSGPATGPDASNGTKRHRPPLSCHNDGTDLRSRVRLDGEAAESRHVRWCGVAPHVTGPPTRATMDCSTPSAAQGGSVLFHITQVHRPESCPIGEGGSNSLFDAKVEGLRLVGRYGANAQHTLFYVVDAVDVDAIHRFLRPGFTSCTSTVTPVSEVPVPKD